MPWIYVMFAIATLCDTCHRYKKAGETGYLNLGDGQKLCSDCSSIAVMNGEECNAIIENVFEFYKSLNLKVDESIPIFFIDKNQMLRFFKGPNGNGALGFFMPSISSCSLLVRIWIFLISRARFILPAILMTEKYSTNGGNIKVAKKAMKLLLGDSIVVLFGRPNVDMGRILAHEMMHAWLHLQGCRPWKWERRVEEGICHVMAYKWMKWFCSSTGFDSWYKTNEQAQYARKLKKYLAQEMEICEDAVYGQGFRDAMCAVERFGFQATLDHTLKNGAVPVVPPSVMYCTHSSSTTTIKSSSFPITELLWKGATSTTKSLWKATATTITELLRKATATFEIPRFIIMEGHRHHQYDDQGQSHKNIQGGSLSASPALLLVFIGILIEHK